MKLQTSSSKALRDVLQKSMKCIEGKSSVAILENVLLSYRDGQFFFTSGTFDSSLTLPAPLSVIEGRFSQSVAIAPGLIVSLLSTLPDCPVTFCFNEDSKTIRMEYCTTSGEQTKAGEVEITYVSGDEYPQMMTLAADATHIRIPVNVLAKVIDSSINFVNRKDELRPVMASLCIDIADDRSELLFAATNGHTLYKSIYSNDPAKGGGEFFIGGEPRQILVHSLHFKPLTVFYGCETVDIESDGHLISFSSGDINMVTKTIDSKYPNYNSVIPKNNPYRIAFSKKEMLDVIKRVSLFVAESSKLIVFSKNGMFIDVKADDVDFGKKAEDQVLINGGDCVDGFSIGFNYLSFLACVNSIEGDSVCMNLSDKSHPVVLVADEPSPKTLTLCMPMIVD